MNSKEAMKAACDKVGVKQVASVLGISPTAIYNQINDPEKKDLFQRFAEFVDACESDLPINWICEEFNGYYVKNPDVLAKNNEEAQNYITSTVKEFGDVLQEVGSALSDGKVTKVEAGKIRKEWEELKCMLESFVLACEYGFVNSASSNEQS